MVALVLCVSASATAQSTLERSPNLEGIWTPRPGVVQFNFLHRFQVTDPPFRKVLSSPTFLASAGVPGGLAVGARYATNSLLVSGRPNEWEVFGRWVPWRQERGSALDVGVQLGRNGTAGSTDGEVLVGRRLGPARLLIGGRGFSSFRGESGELAVVVGTALRLGPHLSVAADAADVLGSGGDRVAWSAGLQLAIPYSPHTLSLHVSNVNVVTLQGATLGGAERRYGFEFTVPVTVRRYLGGGGAGSGPRAGPPGAGTGAGTGAGAMAPGATVDMDNLMAYLPDTVRITAGQSVRWRNQGDIIHTVTADAARAELPGSVRLPEGARGFDSGDMRPGDEFAHVFTVPGEYRYFCVPHERAGMVGVVVVLPPP
jgi:plastocyanin